MKRNIVVLIAVCIFGLAAVWFAIGRSTPVNAQSGGGAVLSSAEASAESSNDSSSPFAPTEGEAVEGGSLISWRVTGATLKPRENDVSYTVDSNGSCVYVTAGDASTVWNAPINLPNGSVVDTLRMYYYDTSGSNTTAWFTKYDLYGAIVDEWSVSSSTSSGNSFNDSAQINETIDYSVYNYVINWRPIVSGSTIQLCGFRVFYTPPPYGLGFIPAVMAP
ncbi:MAG: hypothetical protein WAM60_23585 [Candidatus Promineifilaceae bacterium]